MNDFAEELYQVGTKAIKTSADQSADVKTKKTCFCSQQKIHHFYIILHHFLLHFYFTSFLHHFYIIIASFRT